MQDYDFVIKLIGSVNASNLEEAEKKINAHLDDLGEVNSEAHNLNWAECDWEIKE